MNRAVLDTRSLPKKFIGRAQLVPNGGPLGLWARLIVEMQLVRYVSAMLPFVVLPLMSRDMAPIVAQAPLAMLVVVIFVEQRVLRLTARARERLMPEAAAEQTIDTFTFRAKAALRQFAARRGIETGELAMVVEQSDLARVPPLTFLSVQSANPSPHLIDLDQEERDLLGALFDGELTERDLHRANLRLGQSLREIKIEARGISAHARLSAWMDAQPTEA